MTFVGTNTCLLLFIVGNALGQEGHETVVRPFFETWCVDCHQGSRAKADLDLAIVLDRIDQGEYPASLVRIIERLDERDMPPEDEPRPGEGAYDDAILALEDLLARDAVRPPARTTARRLNRFEYGNTLHDLVGIEIDVMKELPADEIGDGFDNNGDVLSVPPLLMEKYFNLAESTAMGVVASPERTSSTTRRFVMNELRATRRGALQRSVWLLSTRGAVVADFPAPAYADYIVRAAVRGKQAGPDPVLMGITVDGKLVKSFPIESPLDVSETIEVEVELTAGIHVVGAAFMNDYYSPEDPDPLQRDRNAFVEWVEVEGPVRSAFPTELQQQLMDEFGSPDENDALRAMVADLASRAWRCPVEAVDVDALLALSIEEDPGWDRLRRALIAMLVHPRFLFRIESEPAPGESSRPLNGWELATRLSYFLWSTMPDEELRRAAASGELATPRGRKRQVRRMLADPRSRNLARHFATQWLQIRSVADRTPDAELFPDVDDRMLLMMREETERFFDEVLRKRLPIERLLDANWTWLNEPLARHYGIEGISGNRMRKVVLDDADPVGLLRHGSVLVATSNPTRTSPVKRGKWVLEALLDDAPPPPPPGISGLPEDGKVTGEVSLREMLLRHRTDPECAGCHVRMDAMGFALEAFDAVGRERTEDAGIPIDVLGELPDGTTFDGPVGLRDILLEGAAHRQFNRALAKHMATYALGRGLDRRDEPMLEILVSGLEEESTLERLIVDLVETEAFLDRPGTGEVIMEPRHTP